MAEEFYAIGVDIPDNKEESSILMVKRKAIDGGKMPIVKVFIGAEAEEMYERLTNQKVGVIRNG